MEIGMLSSGLDLDYVSPIPNHMQQHHQYMVYIEQQKVAATPSRAKQRIQFDLI